MSQLALLGWQPRVAPRASEQDQQLARVGGRIADLVVAFCRQRVGAEFHVAELLGHVERYEQVAPDSPRRILGQLRRAGQVDVELVSRSRSLYRVVGVR